MNTYKIARLISTISNPLLLLLFVPFVLVYKTSHKIYDAMTWSVYSWGFLFTVALLIIYAVKKKVFTDLDVSRREQRPKLYVACGVFSILYLSGLYLLNGPRILMLTIIGIIAGLGLMGAVNTQIKASVHVATVASLTMALVIAYGGFYILLLLLIPLIAWSRVKIKRHTVPEALAGTVMGFLLTVLMYTIIKLVFYT